MIFVRGYCLNIKMHVDGTHTIEVYADSYLKIIKKLKYIIVNGSWVNEYLKNSLACSFEFDHYLTHSMFATACWTLALHVDIATACFDHQLTHSMFATACWHWQGMLWSSIDSRYVCYDMLTLTRHVDIGTACWHWHDMLIVARHVDIGTACWHWHGMLTLTRHVDIGTTCWHWHGMLTLARHDFPRR